MNLNLTLSSLQDKGYRMTKVRREVVGIFSQTTKPLSVNEVEEILFKLRVFVNKTTVYRELKFLLTNGYLVKVYLHPKQVSYESSELKHHHHLICKGCGEIDSVTNCLVMDLEKNVYRKRGFKIEKHMLEFYGLCKKCDQLVTNDLKK